MLARLIRDVLPALRPLVEPLIEEFIDVAAEPAKSPEGGPGALTVYLWRDSTGWGAQIEGGGSLEPGATVWLAVAEAIRRSHE